MDGNIVVSYILKASECIEKRKFDAAFQSIQTGLLIDNKNAELYLMLGEYYERTNVNQALLCYYQAFFYSDNDDDRNVIQEYIDNAISLGACIDKLSIVIVSKNQSEYLKKCLKSIADTVIPAIYELIVIDDASTDGTKDWLSQIEGITCVHNEEVLGHTASSNLGIKIANPFNDVLLLDADVLLVDNSLFYLMLGLYSSLEVGIVSGLTNDFVDNQKMSVNTENLDEAIKLATNVNCPMQNAYEKEIFVSDYEMLIKRKTIDKIGLFDEELSSDVYADKDYCVRSNMADCGVILCLNSYVFKFTDRNALYEIDDKKKKRYSENFRRKWQCSIDYCYAARNELIEMISSDKKDAIEVLELGCSFGGSLNRIKSYWPNAKVHGIEYVDSVARIGACVTDIIQGDVENMEIPYSKKQFDYIICADVLEHLRNPEDTLKRFIPYLKDSGYFIISLPNIRHYAVIMMLALYGRFDYSDSGILDNTHIKFFTKDTAYEMIENSGLKILDIKRNYNGTSEENGFIQKLVDTFEVEAREELKVFQYYFLCQKR